MNHTHLAPERDLRLVVADRVDGANDIVVLTLRNANGGDLPAWTPGSHVDLVLGDGLIRQYSLSGDPQDKSVWRIGVLREPHGRGGSAYVHDRLTPGVEVEARGPRNHFALSPAASYVFIAGGIGITPILPMVREIAASGLPWVVHYGGRTLSSMAFRQELAELDSAGDRVNIHPQDVSGLLDLNSIMAAADDRAEVYCCGPAPLLEAAEKSAAVRGIAIHIEHFAPKKNVGEPAFAGSFEVVLEQMGVTLTVPPDRSILEVVEEVGADVITSCREGTCGSCETVVLQGTPDHRDSLLSGDVHDTMMICVSRSTTPRLVLDL